MTATSMLDQLLAEARRHVRPYTVAQTERALRTGCPLIDIRPLEYRCRFGEIPGAIAVSRHLLEWRLDVTGPSRLKELADDPSQEIILCCTDGSAACLAAFQVSHWLGLTGVHYLTGGFNAWREAGLPVMTRAADALAARRQPAEPLVTAVTARRSTEDD